MIFTASHSWYCSWGKLLFWISEVFTLFEYLCRFVSCVRKTLTFVKYKMQHCFIVPSCQLNILMCFCMMVQLAQTSLPVKQPFSSTPTRMNCGVHLKLFATCSVNVGYPPCFRGCLFWYLPALMLFLQLK